MIRLRKSEQRGHARHGWLESWHSFSFADYYDPAEMGWSVLRVINEDVVQPGTGFGMHGHRDMEIITYILSGTLRHSDSMGHGENIRRPEVQRMSAGRGVLHSEVNPSDSEPVHLLQIWIEPDVRGISPEYEQRAFDDADKRDRLLPIVSNDGRQGSLRIHQDAVLYASTLSAGAAVSHVLASGRVAYLHMVSGEVSLNGQPLAAGDAAKLHDETELRISSASGAEILLFDLPGLH